MSFIVREDVSQLQKRSKFLKKKNNLVLCDVHMVLEKETLNLLLRKVAVVDGVM